MDKHKTLTILALIGFSCILVACGDGLSFTHVNNQVIREESISNDTDDTLNASFSDFIFPYRIGSFGDRLERYDHNASLKEFSFDSLVKIIPEVKERIPSHLARIDCLSRGKVELNKNLRYEIYSVGWNDLALTDDVLYYSYLVVYDSSNLVLDAQLIAQADNMNELSYSEFSLLDPQQFIIIDYEFKGMHNDSSLSYGKYSTQVVLNRTLFSIDEKNGKISKKKQLTSLEFECDNELNDFLGIFRKNKEEVESSMYWKND